MPEATTSPYAITVEFQIAATAEADFMRLMHENAAEFVRVEPGCLRFDVLIPAMPQDEKIVFLYEIYEDRAAFETHLASGHFKRFDELTRPMVLKKTVGAFAVRENAKARS